MIVITHDLSVLYQIADTILVMYAGKLAEKAPAETMIDAPAHPYTQLLLSSLPEDGIRYAEKRLSGIPGRPPVSPRASEWLPFPDAVPACVRAMHRRTGVHDRRTRSRRGVLE